MSHRLALACRVLAAITGLSSCAGGGGSTKGGPVPAAELPLVGTLTYRARVALPPNSLAIVEVREGAGTDGAVVAERRSTRGQAGPDRRRARVDRARLVPDGVLRARRPLVNGGPVWATSACR
jgi:hypothetical protein